MELLSNHTVTAAKEAIFCLGVLFFAVFSLNRITQQLVDKFKYKILPHVTQRIRKNFR